MNRTTARLSAALFTIALVAIAGPASAHIGVSSTDAAQGGFGTVVFRVPNESEKAATTKVVITLPADAPFASVSAGAKPGWTVDVVESTLDKPTTVGDFALTEAVRTITWTAAGGGIPVGQFDEFALSGGPFPAADSIAFTATQTYDDGEVVTWDQTQTGDEEPEHPAPTLALAATTGSDHHGVAAGEADGMGDDSDLGAWLGGIALAVSVAALVVVLRQNRRRA